MKRILLLVLCISSAAAVQSQPVLGKGFLRAQATLSPGVMFAQNVTNIYLHGDLEYYLDRRISLRGDGFFFIGSTTENKPFQFHHSVFSGASYHFGKAYHGSGTFRKPSNFDPYAGLSMGLAVTRSTQGYMGILPGEFQGNSFNPLFSPYLGFNIYAQKLFHFFAEARYVGGKHFPDYQPALSLSELRLSFGLGWNIRTIKEK